MENTTTIYNKNLETVQDRIDHVAASLNADTVNRRMRELVKQGVTMAENGLAKHLSEVANYIMEAKDIKTNRKIEQSYYKSEKEYGHYKQAETALVDDQSKLDYLMDNKADNAIREPETVELLDEEKCTWLRKKLDAKSVQRYVLSTEEQRESMSFEMLYVYSDLLASVIVVGTRKEIAIFMDRWHGMTTAEIAENRNISVRQVQQQFNNICRKIAERLQKK